MANTIRLEGAKEMRKALLDSLADMEDLKTTHKEAAEIVAMRAAVLAPRRSGLLADSVVSVGTRTKGYIKAGGVRLMVPYAGVIHFGSPRGWPVRYGAGGKSFGSGRIRSQPFMYDAMDDRRNEVLDQYSDRLAEVLRRNGLGVSLVPSLDERLT